MTNIKIGQEFNIYEGDKRVATRVPVRKVLKTRIVLKGGRKFRLQGTKLKTHGKPGRWRYTGGEPALSEIDGPGRVVDSDKEERRELREAFNEHTDRLREVLRSGDLPAKRLTIHLLSQIIEDLDNRGIFKEASQASLRGAMAILQRGPLERR
jgi:hypothetical protein